MENEKMRYDSIEFVLRLAALAYLSIRITYYIERIYYFVCV